MEMFSAILGGVFVFYFMAGFLFFLLFAVSSRREKETQAERRSWQFALGSLVLVVLGIVLYRFAIFQIIASILAVLIALVAAYYLIPAKKNIKGTAPMIQGKVERIDERDCIWARARTVHPNREDRPEYKTYYGEMHPERKERDDKLFDHTVGDHGCIDKVNFHNKMIGGVGINRFMTKLGSPDFQLPQVNKPDPKYFRDLTAQQLTDALKGLCKLFGADVVGVAELNPLWVYSHRGQIHRGNWEDWGTEIKPPHKYVVVFGFGMESDLVRTAPFSPCDIEVYHQYAKAVIVSVEMAHALAAMGIEAKAHHLRATDILLVPAAVDAGLGELSRCGSLITKEFGTRIRLGAITTDAPLVVDQPVDIGGVEFCEACKKCSDQCPLGSIPGDERKIVNGTYRWQIDPEKCYEYWTKSGTHCSLCLSCCPWSHENSFVHRTLKSLASNFHRMHPLMIWADDVFYGRKINSRLGPKWIDFRHEESKQIMLD